MNPSNPAAPESASLRPADTLDAEITRALHESQGPFREVFTHAVIGMALLGLDGRFLQVNESLCRMLGYTSAELIGLTFRERTHPEGLDTILANVEQLLAGELPAFHMEKRYTHKNGTTIWAVLSVALVHDAERQPLYFIAQIQDITDRKLAELAVKEREAWFHALYEQMPDAILLIDPHHPSGSWPIVACNATACRMNGYTRDELIGQPVDLLNAEPATPATRADYLDRLRREGTRRIDADHRRKDGTVFPIRASTTLITVAGREYVIGIDRDMSALKEADQARHLSENRYRTLVEHLPAIIYTAHLDDISTTSYISPQIERILGFTPEEWLAQPDLWFKQVHPDDQARVLREVQKACDDNTQFATEYRVFTREGQLVWFRDTGWIMRDENGQPLFLQGILLDITERKQAEEAAHESEMLFRALARNFPNGAVFLFDHDLRYKLADGQALEEVGYTAAALEGRTLFEVVPPEAAAIQEPLYRAALAGEYRVHELTRDGRRYITYYLPIYMEQDQVYAGLAVTHDITERACAEQALIEERALLAHKVEERTMDLRAANAALVRVAAMKDEFLASMSHELRTPLNAVLGFAEGLQEQSYGPITHSQATALRAIEESGRHLLALINDILDVAKVSAGKMELTLDAVQVGDICEACIRMVRQKAFKKQVSMQCEIDPSVRTVQADARRLKQILVNLLANAVKFTPELGEVGLTVTGDLDGDVVRFTVWDTGIGIAPDQFDRLFQPFVQLDSKLDRRYEGTGLGLALVAGLAELHEGGVSVESEVGVGSRFTVTLPWRTQVNSVDAIADGQAGDRLVGPSYTPMIDAGYGTILLVDDNEASSHPVVSYLMANGYRVLLASSGEEAICIARSVHVGVVLMDIQMPEMDGYETIRQIRRLPTHTVTPIVALTALAMPGDRERCLQAGADEYMSKPVSLRTLRATIDRLLTRT